MSADREHRTMPAIAMPLPFSCVETPITPSISPSVIKMKAPTVVSLVQLLSSKQASITMMPKIIDGMENQYPLSNFLASGFLMDELKALSRAVFFSLNSASDKTPFSFSAESLSI